MNRVNIIAYTLFALSAMVLISTLYFLCNLKVIENWTLKLPDGDIHAGDTIVVQSTYRKLRDVSGESVRYLECKNSQSIWIRYELNRATSNRAKGAGGTGLTLTMRRDVADIPTTCKIDINIRYDVLPFRHVYVSNSTKAFTLLPEITPESSSAAPQAAIQRSLSLAEPVMPIVSSSYTNTTPQAQIPQPNSSQGTSNPEREDPTPTLFETITLPIKDLIGGL